MSFGWSDQECETAPRRCFARPWRGSSSALAEGEFTLPEIVGSLWLMAWFGAIPLVWMAFLASVVVVLQSRGRKPAYPTWNLPMPASRPKIAGFDRRPVLYAVGMALLSLPFVAGA